MTIGLGALGQAALGQAPSNAQTLNPSLVTNTSVFYSPTVVFDQSLTATAPLTNTSVFYEPNAVWIISPPLIASSTTFGRTGAWAERNKQSETWIERSKQSETWTRAA